MLLNKNVCLSIPLRNRVNVVESYAARCWYFLHKSSNVLSIKLFSMYNLGKHDDLVLAGVYHNSDIKQNLSCSLNSLSIIWYYFSNKCGNIFKREYLFGFNGDNVITNDFFCNLLLFEAWCIKLKLHQNEGKYDFLKYWRSLVIIWFGSGELHSIIISLGNFLVWGNLFFLSFKLKNFYTMEWSSIENFNWFL